MMPDDLKTIEKYALAQLIVCGDISYDEFTKANSFLADVRSDTLTSLRNKGYLEPLLYEDRRVN